MGYGKTTQSTSTADRVAAHVARRGMVERGECEDPKRRARLEKDDEAWLKWYCPETYYLPFERPHKAIIDGARNAIETNGDFAVAAERGIGKSAILYGVVFKLAITGEQAFPVYIPWGEKDKAQGFDFWLDCLTTNQRLIADYPEVCQPFQHADGVSQRISTTTWADSGKRTHAKCAITKGIIVFPDGRGVIGSSTMNGNPRGLNHKHAGGELVRPTCALIDDVQDDKTAASQGDGGLVKKAITKVNGAVRGLKRAGADFSILLSGNCIQSGDVMDHFLNQAGWSCVRVACVDQWPDGWDDPKSETRALWDEWGERWLARTDEAAFFRKHKALMCKGMKISAPSAYKQKIREAAADKRKKAARPVNACHAVMREYYTMGHDAFMAERQQNPIDPISVSGPYVLTPDMIKARATKRRPYEKPDWVVSVVASSDVNPSYALSTVVLGLGQDQTVALLWYGLHKCYIPDDLPKPEFDKRLYAELAAHGKELAGCPCLPAGWAIDGGGKNFDAVIRYAADSQQSCGIPALAFTGRGWKQYVEYGKTYIKGQLRREMCHVRSDHKNGRRIQWVPWQSDYWKEIAQRAMLGDVGAPGTCTLPAGSHDKFAAQYCNERLAGKGEVGGKIVWNYTRVPGKNDFLDAMAQGYALGAFNGIGTGGTVARPKQVNRRRVRHVKV